MNQPSYNDLAAATAFSDSMVSRADATDRGAYPLWHGWALREAFLAGLAHERERLDKIEAYHRKARAAANPDAAD